MVTLDQCHGSCNAFGYLFDKTKLVQINVFDVITEMNESKALTKHISCDSKCKFDDINAIQIKNAITITADTSANMKKHRLCKKRLYFKSDSMGLQNY